MKITIDLFSDTNVNPSNAMRRAISNAAVGNEVAGEDPTVNQLLERVCVLLDKPAATFMPSGSMCNSVGLRALCNPGERIILERNTHALNMTAGMLGAVVGAIPEIIHNKRGIFTVEQLEAAIGKNSGYNIAKASLVAIEQTTNLGGGAIWPLDLIHDLSQCAKKHGLYLHMDGARLLNASIATGISPANYCATMDSVWIDFAKGLGAPMGAVIAGSQSFIDKVWHYKFQQGGTLHQAGMMAAACLYALDHNINRIADDHANAQLLGNLLAQIPGIIINPAEIETNIVIFKLDTHHLTASELTQRLLNEGIRLLAIDNSHLRAITHMDIDKHSIFQVAQAIEREMNHSKRIERKVKLT